MSEERVWVAWPADGGWRSEAWRRRNEGSEVERELERLEAVRSARLVSLGLILHHGQLS